MAESWRQRLRRQAQEIDADLRAAFASPREDKALREALEAQQSYGRAARVYGSLIDLFPSRADLRRMAGERLAVVVKLFRVNVIGWVVNRPLEAHWSSDDRSRLASAIEQCRRAAPGAERLLSRMDRALLDLASTPVSPTSELIAAASADGVPAERFTALTRLDENRARAQLAQTLGVPVETVRRVPIWGNHSASQFPDVSYATVGGKPAAEALEQIVGDVPSWLDGTFIPRVAKRGAEMHSRASQPISCQSASLNGSVSVMSE